MNIINNVKCCWRGFAIRANIFKHARHGLQIRASRKKFHILTNLRSNGPAVFWSFGLLSVLITFSLVRCISVFVPVGVKDLSGLLVVEGVILEEGTKIMLSRTVTLDEEKSGSLLFDHVNNAIIHLIDEKQTVIAVARQEYNWGPYVIKEKFSFVPGMKYALDIKTTDDKHFQSSFILPAETPEIDEVNYKVNDDKSIDIFVSTHDPSNKTNYFRWAFDEVWEIRSPIFGDTRYDPITQREIPQSIRGDNRFYCWVSDFSKSIMTASSVKYTNAVIKNNKIHTLQPGNSRYSYLYSILVKQLGMNKEAYNYFENLQRNIEAGGSLFAPQPSEQPGNIKCLSDPEEKVIGFIFASRITTYRLFIPMAQEHNLSYLEDKWDCTPYAGTSFMSAGEAYYQGYGLYIDNGSKRYAPITCVDCTFRGGTKTKPDYWPNDHQ